MLIGKKSKTDAQDKDLWATPWWVFYFAQYYLGHTFDIDVCASAHNTKVANNYITEQQNMLISDWNGEYCWLNPPYSNPKPFVERAIEQMLKHQKYVVMLLNADNSTAWFSLCARYARKIVFITNGRIPFLHNQTGKEMKGNSKGQILVFLSPYGSIGNVRTEYIDIAEIRKIGSEYQKLAAT